ncbi:hypothetical protein ACS0TY_034748 [Phlomoides rotata]
MGYSEESSEKDEGDIIGVEKHEGNIGGGEEDEGGAGDGEEAEGGYKVVEGNVEEGRDGDDDDDFQENVLKGRKEPKRGKDDSPPELKLQSLSLLGSFQSHVANYIWRG